MYKSIFENQYNKCLNMLSEIIPKYEENLWYDHKNYHFLDKTPWPPFEKVLIHSPYTKDEILNFADCLRKEIPGYLEDFKPEENCWPYWYNENQLEFQINNIRHLQHHTAELIERQNNCMNIAYTWK